MDLAVFAKEVYLFFTSRVYSKAADGFVQTPKSVEALKYFGEVFTKRYGNGAGPEYVWFYVAYQFSRYELVNFRPKGFVNFVTPTLVFGKSAISKFGDRTTIDTLTINSQWLKDRKINKQEFVKTTGFTFNSDMKKVDHSKVEKKLQQYRDPIKAITIREQSGPDCCFDMTDLYNDQDVSCQKCPYSEECKAFLKKVNPRLYNLRNYEQRK